MTSPVSRRLHQRELIEFADNMDFYANRQKDQTNVLKIIDEHTTVYEATSKKVKQNKMTFYY